MYCRRIEPEIELSADVCVVVVAFAGAASPDVLFPKSIAVQPETENMTSSTVSIRIEFTAICRINAPIVLKRLS